MNTPDLDLLQQFETSRDEGNLFQSDRDEAAQNRWIKEQSEKLGGAIFLVPNATERRPQGEQQAAGIDTMFGDILDPQINNLPEDLRDIEPNLRCIIEHEPSKQTLKRYGVDETRDVIFHVALIILKEKGLVNEVRFRGIDVADLAVWDNSWYIVRSVHRSAYFGQRASAFFTAAACNRYRLNNVTTNQTAPGSCPEEEVIG